MSRATPPATPGPSAFVKTTSPPMKLRRVSEGNLNKAGKAVSWFFGQGSHTRRFHPRDKVHNMNGKNYHLWSRKDGDTHKAFTVITSAKPDGKSRYKISVTDWECEWGTQMKTTTAYTKTFYVDNPTKKIKNWLRAVHDESNPAY